MKLKNHWFVLRKYYPYFLRHDQELRFSILNIFNFQER